MKRFTCLAAVVAASLTMSINASADGTCAVLTDEFTELGPKPCIVLEYSQAIALADGTALTKETLRANTTLTSTGNTYDIVVGNFDDASNITKLTFIVADHVTLSSDSRYTLTLPALRYVDDSSSAQETGESIILKTATFTTIDASTDYTAPTSASYADNVVIASGTVYTADPTFCCKQLVIEPGAGLLIPSGRAVVVNDSLYVLTNINNTNELDNGFIINEGTLEVKGNTVIYHDVSQNYGSDFYNTRYTSPIFGNTFNSMTLRDPYYEVGYKSVLFHPLYGISPMTWAATDRTTTYTTDNYYQYAFVRNYYYSPLFLRFAGELNNESIDYGTLSDVYGGTIEGVSYVTIPNPFDAPLNMRGLIADEKLTGVRNLYTYRPLNRNSYVAYNVFSGLTTYDEADNMPKGYLLPPTGFTLDYFNGDITYKADRDYCLAPDSAPSLYASTIPFPYVRFAVDYDATSSKSQHGEGNRDVVALYFIPDSATPEDSIIAHYEIYDTEDYYTTSYIVHFPSLDTWTTTDITVKTNTVKIAAMPIITTGTFDDEGYQLSDAGSVTHAIKYKSTDKDTLCITVLDGNLSDYNIKMTLISETGNSCNTVLTTSDTYTATKYEEAATTLYDVDCYYGYLKLKFTYTDEGKKVYTEYLTNLGDTLRQYGTADNIYAAIIDENYAVPTTQSVTTAEVASTPDDEEELQKLIASGGDPNYTSSTAIEEAEVAVSQLYSIGCSSLRVTISPKSGEAYTYRLTDLSGKTVATDRAEGDATVSAPAAGIYFLTLTGGETYKVALR